MQLPPLTGRSLFSLLTTLLVCTVMAIPDIVFGESDTNTRKTFTQNIGVNIGTAGGQVDYQAEKPWTDVMRTHRSWGRIGAFNSPIPLDVNGWPTGDGECLVYHGLYTNNNHGTYALSFECNNPDGVRVTEDWGGGQLTNRRVNGSRVFYDLVITDDTNSQMKLSFINTNGGVRKVKLMRPKTPGGSDTYDENTLFSTPFLDSLKPFSTLRYVHWIGADSPLEHVAWEDRTPWTYATMNPRSLTGWGVRGPAWEAVIHLANTTNTDIWINLPVRATDDYYHNLTWLLRYGNEHVPPLKEHLNIYFEYGNEIWNGGTYYKQWNYVVAEATKHPETAYDGTVDPNTRAFRYQGKRTVEISNIFRFRFGDEAMHTRIRPYLAHQKGYYDIKNRTLAFIDKYYGGKDPRSWHYNRRPVNYYIYAFGGSSYFEPDMKPPQLTIDNIWESGQYNSDAYLKALSVDAYLASMYGLRYITYEGGQHPHYNGDEVITRQALQDQRMYDLTLRQHRAFTKTGADLTCFYRLAQTTATNNITEGHFGMLTGDIANLNQPRYQALKKLITEKPQKIAIGYKPPFVVDGRQYSAISAQELSGRNPGAGSVHLTAGASYATSYAFHVDHQRSYNASFTFSNANPALVQIEFNGKILKEFGLYGAGTSPVVQITCEPDKLHSIRIVSVWGELTVDSVEVAPAHEAPNNAPPESPEL